MKQNHITRQIEITNGTSLILTLCSNPSTGYKWSETAKISDNTVIQQINHSYLEPTDKNLIGAPGKQVWTFEGIKKGTSSVYLGYTRDETKSEMGEWTYELKIDVR